MSVYTHKYIHLWVYIQKYKALAFLWAFSNLKVRLVTPRPLWKKKCLWKTEMKFVCVQQPQRWGNVIVGVGLCVTLSEPWWNQMTHWNRRDRAYDAVTLNCLVLSGLGLLINVHTCWLTQVTHDRITRRHTHFCSKHCGMTRESRPSPGRLQTTQDFCPT